MLGEKAETREMKEQLACYFFSMDVFGAKTYFAEMLKKRPDVLMEASDITGELKLSMQIIATMDQELQRTGHCYLRKVFILPISAEQKEELETEILKDLNA